MEHRGTFPARAHTLSLVVWLQCEKMQTLQVGYVDKQPYTSAIDRNDVTLKHFCLLRELPGAIEMAQQCRVLDTGLRAPASLTEPLNLVTTREVSQVPTKSSFGESDTLFWSLWILHLQGMHTQTWTHTKPHNF